MPKGIRNRSGRKRAQRGNKRGGSNAALKSTALAAAKVGGSVPKSLPFPNRMKCTLTYVERFPAFINNAATVTVYQYSGNSCFDPNFTGTGGQPTYFDQLSALYLRYRVYSSAIVAKFYSTTTAQTTYADVCVVPVNTTQAGVALQNIMNMPRAKFTTLSNVIPKTLTHVATASEILGVKDVEGADRLQALISASPAEQWLWCVAAQSYDAATACTINVDVRVSYDVEFFDRVEQVQSLVNTNRGSFSKNERKSFAPNEEKKAIPSIGTRNRHDFIEAESPDEAPMDQYVVLKKQLQPVSSTRSLKTNVVG
jgi:hypothetical protein